METHTAAAKTVTAGQEAAPASDFAILFELEGIAVNGRAAAFEVMKSILAENGTTLQPHHFARYCLCPAPEHYVGRVLEVVGARKLSASKLIEDVKSGVAMHLTSQGKGLLPGVEALFNEAQRKGFALAALTALPEEDASTIIRKRGLDQWNISLFALNQDNAGDFPRADSWLKMAKALKRSPRQCVALGSSMTACKAALSAGMRCVAIPDSFTSFQDFSGCELVLESLSDVPLDELFTVLAPARA